MPTRLPASRNAYSHGGTASDTLAPDVDRGYARWFGRELSAPEAVLLVAADANGALLGYVYGRLEPRDWNLLLDAHAVLHDVLVDDAARGRGVGRLLLDAFVAAVRALGAPRVVLHTAVANEWAQHVFRELGFRPTMLDPRQKAGSCLI